MKSSLSAPAFPAWQVEMLEWWNQARENAGMTQDAIADVLGLSSEEIERIEKGAALPSLDALQRLANATGTSLVIRLEPKEGEPIGPFSKFLRELGIQITSFRVMERLSHDELALRCGVAAEILSQIEEGSFSPRLEDIWLIARSFDMHIGTLISSVELTAGMHPR